MDISFFLALGSGKHRWTGTVVGAGEGGLPSCFDFRQHAVCIKHCYL